MNPATNATAIAMTITQTQIEAPASFFSSILHHLLRIDTNASRKIRATGFSCECRVQELACLLPRKTLVNQFVHLTRIPEYPLQSFF
jgi:hypothetical protein